jgi:hypothetical protein
MKNPSTYPLRLPRSVKAEVERRAKADGISINQFVSSGREAGGDEHGGVLRRTGASGPI